MDNRGTTANKMRMGTSMRQPTAQRQANYQGVGYNTKVTAIDRPVTNHGMSGINAISKGPGRQIYDRSYYYNLLKNKNTEIVGEIDKMKVEVE
jgi:intraflagellar transport protein 74